MHGIQNRFSRGFNRRFARTGSLWQSRYKAKFVSDQSYLDHLVLYVHLNPVKAGNARLTIYDVTGRRVKTMHSGHLESGPHSLVWQGRDDGGRAVASGVYYLRMDTVDGVQHQKMMLLK